MNTGSALRNRKKIVITIFLMFLAFNIPAQEQFPELYIDRGNFGYMYSGGKIVTEPIYERAEYFSEGLALVAKPEGMWLKYGFIDSSGKEVIPLTYSLASSFSEGLAVVGMKSGLSFKYGFIDKSGKVVVPIVYDYAKNFSEGLAAVVKSDKWKYGFIDKNGKEVIPCEYNNVGDFSGGINWVLGKNRKYGFIDKTGKEIIPPIYDWYKRSAPGNPVWMKSKGMWALFSESGKEILPPTYKEVIGFYAGYGGVKLDKKWGIINADGKEILPPTYDEMLDFHNGNAGVKLGKKWGVIDTVGNIVLPIVFDYTVIDVRPEDLVVVADRKLKNMPLGLAAMDGRMILPPKYNYIGRFSPDGLVIIGTTERKANFWDAMLAANKSNSVSWFFNTEAGASDGETKSITTVHSFNGIRTREYVNEGVTDKNGRIIIPLKNGQHLELRDGVYEIFKAVKTKGSYNTEYVPTGKAYDKSGKLIDK